MNSNTIRYALYAGLIAGTLDGLGAIVVYQADPVKLFQFIASGAFGESAREGGIPMALAGVAFHYLIATTWSFFMFLIYPKIIAVFRSKILTGILYGAFVWCVMNLAVIPLSQIGPRPFAILPALTGMSILVVAIGIPLVFLADRHYRKSKGVVTL